MDPSLLPADVLLEIFSYLSYKDLVAVQFVCSWWRQVSRERRLWRNVVYKPGWNDTSPKIINNLKVSPELQVMDLRYIQRATATLDILQELANGCPYLNQLSISWDYLCEYITIEIKKIRTLILDFEDDDEMNFNLVHKLFPNLEHIDCNSLFISHKDLTSYLQKKKHTLHSIGFRCKTYQSRCSLQCLSVCTSLKKLTLFCLCDKVRHLPEHSMRHLKRITSLTLKDSVWSETSDFLTLVTFFPNLVELHLDNCILRDATSLLEVALNCPLLEKLKLSSLGSYFRDRSLQFMSHFRKLTDLCLRYIDSITNDCIDHLKTIPELTNLEVFVCKGLTPRCLIFFCFFEKLKILKFDLQHCDPPRDLATIKMKNPQLRLMLYNCRLGDTVDFLRERHLRVSCLANKDQGIESYPLL